MAGMMERMLPDVSEEGSHDHITLSTWYDKVMKALTVWLPLLVSGTLFLGELTGEFQSVFCYPPSDLTSAQSNYLNAFCKESLPNDQIWYSLFSYSVPLMALIMNFPHFLWKVSVGAKLKSQITFISKQIESSFLLYLKIVALQAIDIDIEVDSEDDPSPVEREEKRKVQVARRQMEDSVSTLIDFVNRLTISDKKLRSLKIAKIAFLSIFGLLCLGYLIFFATGFQKDRSFACNATISTSNNGTKAKEYIESTCKIIGVKHLYHVSFLLSISFFLATFPLTGFYVFKTYWERGTFLEKLLQNLDRLTKARKETTSSRQAANETRPSQTDAGNETRPSPTDASPFSDFSIISRLCEENRHLIPSFNMIMHKGLIAGEQARAAGEEQTVQTSKAVGNDSCGAGVLPSRFPTSTEDETIEKHLVREEIKPV